MDAGLIGWSEYNESYGSKVLTVVIMKLAEMLIGQDPRPVELITATSMRARARPAQNATGRQAGQCAGRGWGRTLMRLGLDVKPIKPTGRLPRSNHWDGDE